MFSPDRYLAALQFAATKHATQRFPGSDWPYLVHVVTVTAEVTAALPVLALAEPDLAVQCALLHDTIEDTGTTYTEVAGKFGKAVADGVQALSKDAGLPKEAQMQDCLDRIRQQPREIWVVKLCDRIANMDEPPHYWTTEKRHKYADEARLIGDALGEAAPALLARLRARIAAYPLDA
jgi:(p)ppGpp synthase/HD superfamily hydrolase